MERKEFPAGELTELKAPTVFMFAPTHYVVAPPDRLAEWEATMRERTGQPASMQANGLESYCFCGDVIFDDSDWV